MAKKKESHSLSMSEIGSEKKLSVKNPLSGIQDVKEAETTENNIVATAESEN